MRSGIPLGTKFLEPIALLGQSPRPLWFASPLGQIVVLYSTIASNGAGDSRGRTEFAPCALADAPLRMLRSVQLRANSYGLICDRRSHFTYSVIKSSQKNYHPIHSQTTVPSTSNAIARKFPAFLTSLTKQRFCS